MKFKLLGIALLSLTMLGGCGSIQVKDAIPLSEVPQVSDIVDEYFIQVGDVLRVALHSSMGADPLMQGEEPLYTVRPDGRIYLPMLQEEVRVAGYTVSQIRARLLSQYSSVAKFPEVLINVVSFAPRTIYVMGELRGLPGTAGGGAEGGAASAGVPYTTSLTALRAVASTGYDVERADLTNVVVVRTQGLEGKPVVVSLDLIAAVENRDHIQDITLMPNDVVFVPRKGVTVVNDFIEQYINRNIPMPGLVTAFGIAYAID